MGARHLIRLAATTALIATAVALPATTADASSGYCEGTGVSVVVDYGSLGGVAKACGHGSTAAAAFTSAGFKLKGTPRMAGDFVCTIDGRPSDGQCTGTSAYWGLFKSDAGNGWHYARLGAGSQPVADGDTVAFAWQSSNHQRRPAVNPAPAPTKTESVAPTEDPASESAGTTDGQAATDGNPTTAATGSASPGASPSASPSTVKKRKAHKAHKSRKAATKPAARSGRAAEPTRASVTDDGGDSGGGLPWWVPVGVVVLLGAGGGTVALRRARGGRTQ